MSALPDAAARRLARERFDVPVLLEAGAGTGKTTALVSRLLVWLMDVGWREAAANAERAAPGDVAARALDGVVAITFTEAAAAEMAERLARELAAIANGKPSPVAPELAERLAATDLGERAAALSDALARARVQTIHAFCRALLAAHPFDAGVHPAFVVDADGAAAERVVFEVVAERFSERLAAGDADWLELLAAGSHAPALFEATLAALHRSVGSAELALDPFSPDRVAAAIRDLQAPLEALRAPLAVAAPRAKGAVGLRVLAGLEAIAAAWRGDPAAEALAAASERADELCAAAGEGLKSWTKGESVSKLEAAWPAGSEALPVLAVRALGALERLRCLRPAELARARRVVGGLLGEARARLDREGFLLYDDLLERAARLLERHADVRAAARRTIRQLLVDEFQDTDRRQCALVSALALDGPPAERPGLFVVGDPKQSIYGWRDADLEAYERFLAAARAAGAVSARLEVNFRSTPAVLEEIARTVGPAFSPEPGLQPAFEPLAASPDGVERGAGRAAAPAVEFWLSLDPTARSGTRSGAATAIEARAVAEDLARSRASDRKLRWRDFALLARTSSDFERYLEALRAAGIPFAVERDRSYWRRREIIDAAALVRAVIDPGDTLALVAFLRSPFVGVPDAAWLPLWEARFPELAARLVAPGDTSISPLAELLRRVAASLEVEEIPGLERVAGWEESAVAALEALAELRERLGREPAGRFVERLRARVAPEPLAAARFLGQFGAANLDRFLRELEVALEHGGDDPPAVARFLRRAVAEHRAAEEAKPPASDADAVRVLTVHRAKGLEFDTVYLLQAHKGEGGDRGGAKAFDSERRGGELEYQLLGHRTLGWSTACERRVAIARHERVRLFYVATTRAKNRLVIAGQPFVRDKEKTLLPLLEPRWRETLTVDPGTLPLRDTYGALWRAPALEAGWRARPESSAPAEQPVVDDEAKVAREAASLADDRVRAAARASRPRFARASDFGGFEPDDAQQPREFLFSSGNDQDEKRKASIEGVRDRALARARGVALHRALELHPLAESDVETWRERVVASFRSERPAATAAELEALSGDADRLRLSLQWKQLSLLSRQNRIEARELPMLLGADGEASSGPTEGFVGTLDLLYRDPDSGELVVADFKSDEILGEESVAAKVAAYAPQLEVYGRAVRLALGLERIPRLELWLLGADRIVTVPPARAAGGESG